MTIGHRGALALTLAVSMLWGLWWMPVRLLEGAGMRGVWPSLAMGLFALPPLGWLAWRAGAGGATARAVAGALLVGVALMLYGASLAFTEVVRAVVLFYLAPAWSTLIECVFMGRRWTWRSAAALSLGLAGVATIFRLQLSLDAINGGDLAALVSGMCWAVGSAVVFGRPGARPEILAFCAALGMGLTGAALLALGGPAMGGAPDGALSGALPLAALAGLAYIAPALVVTLWAAQRLAPATLSFLLTAEIVAGVGSGALFLSEPFGWPEALGAALITAGALTEALRPPPRRPGAPAPEALRGPRAG